MNRGKSNPADRLGGRAVLGALREVKIVKSKPVFSAEILSLIVENLDADDLISCARVSKRMREMVYDDTRWVRRLQLLGCWNEASARKAAEESLNIELSHRSKSANHRPVAHSAPLILLNTPTTPTFSTSSKKSKGENDARIEHQGSLIDAENNLKTSPTKIDGLGDPSLNILEMVKSRRGSAREEYGKVHAVLAPYYKDAVKCKVPSGAKVFRAYRNPEQQAKMVSQLLRFSEADIAPGWSHRHAQISAVSCAFEDAISAEFELALQANDIDGKMRKYAHVLFYLNGAQGAANSFLRANSLLASPYRLGNARDCIGVETSQKFLSGEYLAFLQRVGTATTEQGEIIDRVFPPGAAIADAFLGRLADSVFKPYLSALFQDCQETNQDEFIRAITETYLQNMSFLRTMKSVRLFSKDERLKTELEDFYEPFIAQYLEDELSSFQRKSDAEVTGWERQLSQQDASLEAMYMAGVNRQVDKRDFLSSFKKVVMAPVNILPTISFGAKTNVSSPAHGLSPPSRSASRSSRRMSKMDDTSLERSTSVTREKSRSPSPFGEAPTTELEAKAAIMQTRLEGIKSLFSLEVALSLVHMAKTSIERIAIFAKSTSSHSDAARARCESIFSILIDTLGSRHVQHGFDQAVEHMSNYNPKTAEGRDEFQGVAPLVTFLELVNVGDLIQQMVDVFYEQELVTTKLTDKNDFLNNTVRSKKKFEQMLDERVAAGLNKGIEVLMAEVEYLCATTQGPGDYNPGASIHPANIVIEINITETTRRVVDLVSSHIRMLVGSTDKTMLEVFNQEVGMRLFTILCKHLKRQRISAEGAPRLMSDMNHYFAFIQTLKNKDLLLYFRALRELSQIYLIDGNNAKELATIIADHDRYSGIFGADEVLEFAERRSDWYQIRPKVEKAMYGMGCGVM